MATKYVTIHMTASYTVEVDVEDTEEAKSLAMRMFEDADFGEAEDIEGEVFCIEDGNGNRLFEED